MSPTSVSELRGQAQVLPRFSAHVTALSRRPNRTRFERSMVFGSPRGRVANSPPRPWCLSRAKRTVDLLGAAVLLVLSAPVFLFAAIAIKLATPGPIFFRQWRTGFRGERFLLLKFRTMREDADDLKESLRLLNHHGPNSPDFKIRNHPQVTPVGRVLRRLSLDELPNLLNVLAGQMSLVGPRPTSFDICSYEDRHLVRLTVPPGLTGLWQISGRGDVDFDGRVELDSRYIQNQSPLLDLKILILTPMRVLWGRGAY